MRKIDKMDYIIVNIIKNFVYNERSENVFMNI